MHFPGSGELTAEAITGAVSAIDPGFGRIRTICSALSALARRTAHQQPGAAQQPEPATEMQVDAATAQLAALQEQAVPAAGEISDGPQPMNVDTTEIVGQHDCGDNTTATANGTGDVAQDEASLHVFSNPLFNSATPARPLP